MKLFKFFKSSGFYKFTFFFLGIASTVWFLIRVIPKPSRASYPCMKASAPIMSSFVLYLISLFSSIWILKKTSRHHLIGKFSMVLVLVAVSLFSFTDTSRPEMKLVSLDHFKVNSPIGTAQGIFPGRVTWVYDNRATNENMINEAGDYWYMDKNCDQQIVDDMLQAALMDITGKTTTIEAWDALFNYYNTEHGKGEIGYIPGEKIAIKINLTNSGQNTPSHMDASPQLCLALLTQLIEVVHVAQSDIWFGDNYRTFRDEYWDKLHTVFPDVHYVDGTGYNGREKTVPSSAQLLKFSDGQNTSSIPQHYINASYFINMACLKSHDTGGITLAAKNHQGSILQSGIDPKNQSAMYMHYSLPGENPGYGKYRHLVDYMGHKDIGGKTLLYLIDGLWAGRNWNGILEKWQMAPFNNDYPSSLFVSQDAVSIESVCFDFLLTEYTDKSDDIKYPYMDGVDDYLLQAADPANWPEGIQYDPEGDGTKLTSMGVYEHWNNATDKQYSRNLGTGNGIELKKVENLVSTRELQPESNYLLYPNPFSTELHLTLNPDQPDLSLFIYTLDGSKRTIYLIVIKIGFIIDNLSFLIGVIFEFYFFITFE